MQIDRIFCFPRFSIKAGFAEALKREKHAPQKFDTCNWPRSYPFIPVQKINKRSISVSSLSEMSFVHSPSFPSLSLARKALDRVSKEEKSLSLSLAFTPKLFEERQRREQKPFATNTN